LRSHPAGLRQSLPLGGAPPGDVEHQAAPVAELALHSQAGELLHRIENLPFGTDELLQIVAPVDAHHRAITLDVQVDVPVEVEDVQQLLEVVAGDLALLDKTLFRHHDVLAGHGPASVTTADHSASVDAEPFPQVWDKVPDAGASGTLSSRMGALESALLLLFLLPGAGLLLRGSGLSRARVLRTLARRGLGPRRQLRTGCGCGARLRSAPGSACRRLVVVDGHGAPGLRGRSRRR